MFRYLVCVLISLSVMKASASSAPDQQAINLNEYMKTTITKIYVQYLCDSGTVCFADSVQSCKNKVDAIYSQCSEGKSYAGLNAEQSISQVKKTSRCMGKEVFADSNSGSWKVIRDCNYLINNMITAKPADAKASDEAKEELFVKAMSQNLTSGCVEAGLKDGHDPVKLEQSCSCASQTMLKSLDKQEKITFFRYTQKGKDPLEEINIQRKLDAAAIECQ